MNNTSTQELVEVDKQNFLDAFLQSIHSQGWLASSFIKDDESKTIKAFFISDNMEIVGDQEKTEEGWYFHFLTRNRLFFEQRMRNDHILLFELATMKIAVDEEGLFSEIQTTAQMYIDSFEPEKNRIEEIEKSFRKAVIAAESCKKNNRNLSTAIIAAKTQDLLELLFLKNSKPFPGMVYGYNHYRELENIPAGFSQMFEALLESGECIMRTERFSHCVRLLTKL